MRSPIRPLPIPLGLVLAALIAALAPRGAQAQSVGFEAGVAAVENFDGSPNVGVSLFLPLTERFRGVASYSQWTGCPHDDCADPRVGYGNRGVNLLGLFRVLGDRGPTASLGAGAGWYEKHRLEGGESESYFEEALTFSGELRFPVAFNSATYLRGDLSIPTDDDQPRWGFVRLGVDVGVF